VILFLMTSGGLLVNGHVLLALMALPGALVGVLLLLVYGPIRADTEGIWMEGSLECVGIGWTQIRQIRFGTWQLVLEGEGKRLVLPKPCFWSGPGRTQVLEYVQMLARDYLTPPPPSRTADLVISRNAAKVLPSKFK
jgi:hypothetical protein